MKNLTKLSIPIASVIGAFSVVAVSCMVDGEIGFEVLTLVFMHTALAMNNFENIVKEKWKVVFYVSSIVLFLLTGNFTLLLILNIIESFDGQFCLSGVEREVDVN